MSVIYFHKENHGKVVHLRQCLFNPHVLECYVKKIVIIVNFTFLTCMYTELDEFPFRS